jgi:hypothetical protein
MIVNHDGPNTKNDCAVEDQLHFTGFDWASVFMNADKRGNYVSSGHTRFEAEMI